MGPPARGGFIPPDQIAGLRSWWDALDSAAYDGSNWLLTIADKGPDGLTMAPAKPSGMLGRTVTVGADAAAFLPGRSAVTSPDSHPETAGSGTVTDFTLGMLIPAEIAPLTQNCYYSWNISFAFGLLVQGSGTPGAIDIADSTGVKAIAPAGMRSGAGVLGAGAHSIFILRRAGGRMKIDVWYDQKLGAGVVKPTQIDIADPLAASIATILTCVGGRSSITQAWPGDFHTAWWHDRGLSDAEVLSLAQWGGNRLNISGIV